jgi:hypothetical protein
MCPACLTAAALAVAGTTSTGALTALVVRRIRRRRRKGGPESGPQKNCDVRVDSAQPASTSA